MPNRRFNERTSPQVRSRRIMAIQVLRQLYRNHDDTRDTILKDLALSEDDLVETMEWLYQKAIDGGDLGSEECGSCGHYHRPEFRDDCRNDDERFPGW